jgi:hypothetical protein
LIGKNVLMTAQKGLGNNPLNPNNVKEGVMKDPFKQQGAFSWCELVTTDASAAKDFIPKGW